MPTADYNIGQDNSLVLTDPAYGRLDFKIITDFEWHEMTATTKVRPMRGPALQDEIPEGIEGSFSLDRGSVAVDDYIAKRAASFYATNSLSTGTLYQYIYEVDGSRSVWEYTRVSLKLADGGHYKGGDTVKQKLSFFASERRRVA